MHPDKIFIPTADYTDVSATSGAPPFQKCFRHGDFETVYCIGRQFITERDDGMEVETWALANVKLYLDGVPRPLEA